MKRYTRIMAALLLAAMLCCPAARIRGKAAAETELKLEANTAYMPELYPYSVSTPSSTWYIARADIELMGLEEICSSLGQLLEDQEADFADARNALSGCLKEEIPPVIICTDFSGHAEISKASAAYYNGVGNFIKVFHSWDSVRASLMHEYVHYLTFACAETRCSSGFWAEGIAEWVTRIACRSRLSRSVNMGLSGEEILFFREKGAWDDLEECIDEKILYYGLAELFRAGHAEGQQYYAVSNTVIERTQHMRQDLKAEQLSFYEAACMTAYLIETCGEETVFTHWDRQPDQEEEVFGKSFSELYQDWAEWNSRQCSLMGIVIE